MVKVMTLSINTVFMIVLFCRWNTCILRYSYTNKHNIKARLARDVDSSSQDILAFLLMLNPDCCPHELLLRSFSFTIKEDIVAGRALDDDSRNQRVLHANDASLVNFRFFDERTLFDEFLPAEVLKNFVFLSVCAGNGV